MVEEKKKDGELVSKNPKAELESLIDNGAESIDNTNLEENTNEPDMDAWMDKQAAQNLAIAEEKGLIKHSEDAQSLEELKTHWKETSTSLFNAFDNIKDNDEDALGTKINTIQNITELITDTSKNINLDEAGAEAFLNELTHIKEDQLELKDVLENELKGREEEEDHPISVSEEEQGSYVVDASEDKVEQEETSEADITFDEEDEDLKSVGSEDFAASGNLPKDDTKKQGKLKEVGSKIEKIKSEVETKPEGLPEEDAEDHEEVELEDVVIYIPHDSPLSNNFNKLYAKQIEKLNKCKTPVEEKKVFDEIVIICNTILQKAEVKESDAFENNDFASNVVAIKKNYQNKSSEIGTKDEEVIELPDEQDEVTYPSLLQKYSKSTKAKSILTKAQQQGIPAPALVTKKGNLSEKKANAAIKAAKELKKEIEKDIVQTKGTGGGLSSLIRNQNEVETSDEKPEEKLPEESEMEFEKEYSEMTHGPISEEKTELEEKVDNALGKRESRIPEDMDSEPERDSEAPVDEVEIDYAKYFKTNRGKTIAGLLTELDKKLRDAIKQNETTPEDEAAALAVLAEYENLKDFIVANRVEMLKVENVDLGKVALGIQMESQKHLQTAADTLFNVDKTSKAIDSGNLIEIAKNIKEMEADLADPQKTPYIEFSQEQMKIAKEEAQNLIEKQARDIESNLLLPTSTVEEKVSMLGEIGKLAAISQHIGTLDNAFAAELEYDKRVARNYIREEALNEYDKVIDSKEKIEEFKLLVKKNNRALRKLRRKQTPELSDDENDKLSEAIAVLDVETEGIKTEIIELETENADRIDKLGMYIKTLIKLGTKPSKHDVYKLGKLMDIGFIPKAVVKKVVRNSINVNYNHKKLTDYLNKTNKVGIDLFELLKTTKEIKNSKSEHRKKTFLKNVKKQTALLKKKSERKVGQGLKMSRVSDDLIDEYGEAISSQENRLKKIRNLDERRESLKKKNEQLVKFIKDIEAEIKKLNDEDKEVGRLNALKKELKDLKKAKKDISINLERNHFGKSLATAINKRGKKLKDKSLKRKERKKIEKELKKLKIYNQRMVEINKDIKKTERKLKEKAWNEVIINANEARKDAAKAKLKHIRNTHKKMSELKKQVKGMMSPTEINNYIKHYNAEIIKLEIEKAKFETDKLKEQKEKIIADYNKAKKKNQNRVQTEEEIKKINEEIDRRIEVKKKLNKQLGLFRTRLKQAREILVAAQPTSA